MSLRHVPHFVRNFFAVTTDHHAVCEESQTWKAKVKRRCVGFFQVQTMKECKQSRSWEKKQNHIMPPLHWGGGRGWNDNVPRLGQRYASQANSSSSCCSATQKACDIVSAQCFGSCTDMTVAREQSKSHWVSWRPHDPQATLAIQFCPTCELRAIRNSRWHQE